jgi:hypothetical protein
LHARLGRSSEGALLMMFDAEICATPCELCSFELSVIVCQDPLWYAKFIDYTLQEFDCYLLCDVYYWHGFHPFDERVDSDD